MNSKPQHQNETVHDLGGREKVNIKYYVMRVFIYVYSKQNVEEDLEMWYWR